MKVIAAGLPKTGTKSMHWALDILGYGVYDFPENCFLLGDDYWKLVNRGWTTKDFRRMYENVDATVDFPSCFFWEEISKAFPDAKIVLTTRDNEEDWVRSYIKHMEIWYRNPLFKLMKILSPTYMKSGGWIDTLGIISFGTLPQSIFQWKRKYNESMYKLKYRTHNAYVQQNAPKEKLLIFKCSDGWEPLCKFLGVPIPDEPFPHMNKGGSMTQEASKHSQAFRKIRNEIIVSSSLLVAAMAIMGIFIFKYGFGGILNAVFGWIN